MYIVLQILLWKYIVCYKKAYFRKKTCEISRAKNFKVLFSPTGKTPFMKLEVF